MSRISIVGGNGLTAHHLISRLAARGDRVVAFIRSAEQSDVITQLGATPVVLDLESSSVAEYARAFAGSDAVVFAAGVGSGGGSVEAIDRDGAIKSIDAAIAAGVPRFVQISALGSSTETPVSLTGPFWTAYYAAKRAGDAHLRESTLAWTILEPGALTEDLATDAVTVGGSNAVSGVETLAPISRADVAAAVVAVLDTPGSVGKTWELIGGETSIVEAVAAAAE